MPRKPPKKSKKSNGFAYEFPRTKAPKPKKSPAKRMKPTPTRDEGRKLEEIRKLANRVHDAGPVMGPAFGMALDILDILNPTPTAKGGRT
jgi:hypothetical protein